MAFTTDGLNVGERRVGFYSRRGNRTSCRGGRWTGRNSSCTATTRSAGKRRCSIKGGGAFTPDLRGRSSTRTSWQVSLKRRRAISAWSLCTTNTNKRTLEGHLKTFDQERWKHSSLSSDPLMCLYTRKKLWNYASRTFFRKWSSPWCRKCLPSGPPPSNSVNKGCVNQGDPPPYKMAVLWTISWASALNSSKFLYFPSVRFCSSKERRWHRSAPFWPQVIRLFFLWRFILIFSGGGEKKNVDGRLNFK